MTAIASILDAAHRDGRAALLEHEVYGVLNALGIATPRFLFIEAGQAMTEAQRQALAELGESVVLKIVSDQIVHKSDVGGVRVVSNAPALIDAELRAMLDDVPCRFLDSHPDVTSVQIRGVLILEKIAFERAGLGSEVLISFRDNREFGEVLTLGVGGIETEWISAACRPGRAVASQSLEGASAEELLRGFDGTLAIDRLLGRVRGGRPLVERDALIELFQAFIRLSSSEALDRFEIVELEVNPFAVSGGRLVALDGLCRFAIKNAPRAKASLDAIQRLLRPKSVALIGASAKSQNMGRIILRNVIEAGFDRARLYVIRPGLDELDGVRCVPSLAALPERVDLLIVAVDAAQVPGLIEEVVESQKAVGVILIPGGMGEKEGGADLEGAVKATIARGRAAGVELAVNGGNCLGIVSRPGNYHTLFIPLAKLPLRADATSGVAIVSQSGAYLISRLSKLEALAPRYAISAGNQVDLTVTDHLRAMLADPEVRTIGLYVEGFQDGDGRDLCRAVREAQRSGRDVIFYKAGRTSEGQQASAGHTASLAGDFELCASLVARAGALVAQDFDEFLDLLKISAFLGQRRWGRGTGELQLAALTNAGFEAVGISDALHGEGFDVELSRFSEQTRERLQAALTEFRLDALVDVRNPFDLTPMANDAAHEAVMRAFMAEDDVEAILCSTVPLTPAMNTLFVDDAAARSE
ncbi:MAG: acetate--CoA ligase family protein, partial [Myxococcales bacterium]|nr:acetate--CoA ligase family protein [Myxococcales bacterium]